MTVSLSTSSRMFTRHLAIVAAALGCATTLNAQGTRLLRHPAVSKDLIAFEYAGDLWVVGRTGGSARRLTATPGVETDPSFSDRKSTRLNSSHMSISYAV